MLDFSPSELLTLLVTIALICIPAARILVRTGHSAWWCLLLLVPVVNMIMYWNFAFKRWPSDAGNAPRVP